MNANVFFHSETRVLTKGIINFTVILFEIVGILSNEDEKVCDIF